MNSQAAIRASFSQCNRGLKTVSIVGAGVMGTGIAQVSLHSGYEVTLVDVDHRILANSVGQIRTSFSRMAHRRFDGNADAVNGFIESRLSNLKTSVDLTEAVLHSDLVVEAIIEKLSAKQNLFRILEQHVSPNCILTTNTSSVTLKDIGAVLNNQTRFAGLHFFQPVPIQKLVEVIRSEHTSEITNKALMDFTRSLNKTPITCKDTPGFVVNRLMVPYLLEAVRMVERGDASCQDVDTGMKLGAGYPMGPFELLDLVGLDTVQYICENFSQQMPDDPQFLCPPMISRLVSENKLGKKTGEGFYSYTSQEKTTK